jgi:hypothetical protein
MVLYSATELHFHFCESKSTRFPSIMFRFVLSRTEDSDIWRLVSNFGQAYTSPHGKHVDRFLDVK